MSQHPAPAPLAPLPHPPRTQRWAVPVPHRALPVPHRALPALHWAVPALHWAVLAPHRAVPLHEGVLSQHKTLVYGDVCWLSTTPRRPAAARWPTAPRPADPRAAQTAASRPGRPAAQHPWYSRLSWLLALGAGALGYIATFVIMVLTRNPTMVPTVLLVGAVTIPLTVLLFAQSSRLGPLVPTSILLLTAGLGGLFAICAAGLEEAIAGLLLGRGSILLVGVIEETAKLVVPLIVLALAHRRTRGGGIVIGIASGMGFAVLETMGYGFTALLARDGGLGALDATLVLRGILVPAGHVAWTGAICAALWYLVETSHTARGVLALLTAYLGAIVLHTAWDAAASGALHLLIRLVSIVALLTLTLLAHRAFVRRGLPLDAAAA